MPIEIRELHIRVSVSAPAGSRPAGAPGPGTGVEAGTQQALVAECVERVLEVLQARRER